MESLTIPGTSASHRVAANVRAELAARQIKHAAFGASLGWSKAGTSRRLNGHMRWEIDEVEAAAQALGVTVEALSEERAA